MAKSKAAVAPVAVTGYPDEVFLELLAGALLKGLPPATLIPPGKHQVRGTVTIAVDCWLEKSEPTEARASWPAKDILGLALGLAVDDRDKLIEIMGRAAKKALDLAAKEKRVNLGDVAYALDAVHTANLDRLPRVPREGATKVSGNVTIVDFAQAK